jgi:hypothetical protein
VSERRRFHIPTKPMNNVSERGSPGSSPTGRMTKPMPALKPRRYTVDKDYSTRVIERVQGMQIAIDVSTWKRRVLDALPLAPGYERLLSALPLENFQRCPLGVLTRGQVDEWIGGMPAAVGGRKRVHLNTERKTEPGWWSRQVSVVALDDRGCWSVALLDAPGLGGTGYARVLRRASSLLSKGLEAGGSGQPWGPEEAVCGCCGKAACVLGEKPAATSSEGQPIRDREYGMTRSNGRNLPPDEKKIRIIPLKAFYPEDKDMEWTRASSTSATTRNAGCGSDSRLLSRSYWRGKRTAR